MMQKKIEKHISALLEDLGEDTSRDGLEKTPERVAKSLQFLTKGNKENADNILKEAVFKGTYRDPVIVTNIEFFSTCEHHMMPFFGRCHIAYIPSGKIVGLSKLARVVEVFARRLQVQERLTKQIADTLYKNKALKPNGVAVIIEAYHTCMAARGVQKNQARMITKIMHGAYKNNDDLREELLHLVASDNKNFGF